jgi:hypothetical protein
MRRKRVDSSAIAAIGYDDRLNVLEVEFTTGRIYDYFLVPPSVHDALIHADSIGQYFNQTVKPNYRGILVRAPR